jgi:hypothetical protein
MKQILSLRRCSFATEDDMTSPTRAKRCPRCRVPPVLAGGTQNCITPLTSACHQAINDDERPVHQWRVRQLTGLGIP